jgi:DNA polymerase elongation subunit (family B)
MKTHDFKIANVDTDSISFSKADGQQFSTEEQENLLMELNSLYPDQIKWEHDGIYSKVVILKAKNYVTKDINGKIKTKGSALKSSKIEYGVKEFLNKIVEILIEED